MIKKKDKKQSKKDKKNKYKDMAYQQQLLSEEGNSVESKKKNSNKEYTIVIYLFVGIFVSLIGWVVYFNTVRSGEFINSPYNKRQDTFADRVVRGDIVSSDGEILATTEVGEDGTETRVYPYGREFAHLVGYTSKGKSGLESMENFQLLSSHAFIGEKIINEIKNQKNQGDTLVSTVNAKLQKAAYSALGDYRGAVVALEPSTGKVLAMVSKPDFNPNKIDANWEELISDNSNSLLLNRATQGLYPPGSIYKVITALAYYREHGGFEGYTYNCTGEITPKDGNDVHCYNGNAHGEEDMYKAFAKSCNTAFSDIGIQLGIDKLKEASQDLLFNEKLSLDLPYNKSRFTLKKTDGEALTMLTSIGQGDTLVTPMHMAMVTATIANGGTLMKPYLVDSIENYNGDIVEKNKPTSIGNLITVEEATALSTLMSLVVENGTAKALKDLEVTVAGKTGSAEYFQDGKVKTHSWFIGYSNVENPDLVISVIAEGAGTGSDVAVPIAKNVFRAYYNQ